jgi:REP element-mobilizing transposase RayT
MVFHLTSRLHRRERWFVRGVCEEVSSHIQHVVGDSDADLLAYAIMPTHLHLILRQGPSPLEDVMQPLLRRAAISVHSHHRFEGTVFERRYRDTMCRSPDHIREAIVYVHLNPWRAGLCGDDHDYRWMTHAAYLPGADSIAFGIAPGPRLDVLQLFAQAETRTQDDLCRDYLTWLACRMNRDGEASEAVEERGAPMPTEPNSFWGDRAWRSNFAGEWNDGWESVRGLPDLRDYVVNQMAAVAPGTTLDQLRGSGISHAASRCRARIMGAAARRGFRTGAIARLFNVSPATVSKAKRSLRPSRMSKSGSTRRSAEEER